MLRRQVEGKKAPAVWIGNTQARVLVLFLPTHMMEAMMRYVIILTLMLSSPAYAFDGFFAGGVADGASQSSGSYQKGVEQQLERSRQQRLIEENNDILREQRDRQWQDDLNRIFGIKRH